MGSGNDHGVFPA
ncbi:rCG26045, partial [Rattus norvegicus]